LEDAGFKGRAVSMNRLRELEKEIAGLRDRHTVDETFYRERLTGFRFSTPEILPGARSIIIVAAPQPVSRLTFLWKNREYSVIVPPTYSEETDRQAHELIREVVEPRGFRVVKARLPEKMLATRSGLARYGKNNITYVEGMGSFHRPVAFITDAPLPEDSWGEPRVLERCAKCGACEKKCPTGAIAPDRFLLHAEKCLTFFNESERPFPGWLDVSVFQCLIGCMLCQEVCPANKSFFKEVFHTAAFSEEETAILLENRPKSQLPPALLAKLEPTGLLEEYTVLSRNLSVLLSRPLTFTP
jgi:epoxyqueuosine reductase